jgi:putative transposase
MPRRARFCLAGLPQHIIQRGNNRQVSFFTEEDYRFYIDCLSESKRKYGCLVHAYVLMTNHVHLLASANEVDGLSRMMQHLGRSFVRYINGTYRRTGTLWEGRFKASLVDSEQYYMRCCHYIENNPVRAGMVRHPAEHAWSSYRFHASGDEDRLVSAHEMYQLLGSTPEERQRHYRESFRNELAEPALQEIRDTVNRGWPLGRERFKDEIAGALQRITRPPKRGRPRRENPGKSGKSGSEQH